MLFLYTYNNLNFLIQFKFYRFLNSTSAIYIPLCHISQPNLYENPIKYHTRISLYPMLIVIRHPERSCSISNRTVASLRCSILGIS